MNKADLLHLLPQNKEDSTRATALAKLGHPAVAPVLDQMLDWLRTNGSPVDLVMREFFAGLGLPAIPAVRKALRSKHGLLHHTILEHVVTQWPGSAVEPLSSELQSLATGSGFYGTDLVALRLLATHHLAEPKWLSEWAVFKVKRLRELLSSAEATAKLLEYRDAP